VSCIESRAATERLGDYPLISIIGTGSMGVVYRSVERHTRRPIALKTLRPELLNDASASEFAARLRLESEAARRLSHPGIVSVRGYGEAPRTYISMEYVDARSLKACLDEGMVFSLSRTVAIMAQVLDALQHAHDRGVWHRDVKPSNLLLAREDRVKVTDFGIARIDSPASQAPEAILGSPGYIAPEAYLGETCDQRADVFAAGVVLYLLLAGAPPFYGTPTEIMLKVCYGTVQPPSVVAGSAVIQPLDGVVIRALARHSEERFASAAQFRTALLDAHEHGGSDGKQ
jgi:eukaryotic-like serine/threonine-protein kinase